MTKKKKKSSFNGERHHYDQGKINLQIYHPKWKIFPSQHHSRTLQLCLQWKLKAPALAETQHSDISSVMLWQCPWPNFGQYQLALSNTIPERQSGRNIAQSLFSLGNLNAAILFERLREFSSMNLCHIMPSGFWEQNSLNYYYYFQKYRSCKFKSTDPVSSDPKATCVTRDATTNTVRKASFTTGQDKQFTLYQPCYQKDILSNRCIIEICNYP